MRARRARLSPMERTRSYAPCKSSLRRRTTSMQINGLSRKKFEKILALHEDDLGRIKQFRGDLVDIAAERGARLKHFARATTRNVQRLPFSEQIEEVRHGLREGYDSRVKGALRRTEAHL